MKNGGSNRLVCAAARQFLFSPLLDSLDARDVFCKIINSIDARIHTALVFSCLCRDDVLQFSHEQVGEGGDPNARSRSAVGTKNRKWRGNGVTVDREGRELILILPFCFTIVEWFTLCRPKLGRISAARGQLSDHWFGIVIFLICICFG